MGDKLKKTKATKAKGKAAKKVNKRAARAHQPPDWATATRYEIYRD